MSSYSGKEVLDSDLAMQLNKDFGRLYDVNEANIPERYRPLSLSSLCTEMDEVKNKIKHYFWEQKKSIILASATPGAGKTVMAVSACFAGVHHMLKRNMYLAKFIDYKKIPDQKTFDKEGILFWKQTNKTRTWIIDNVQVDESKYSSERIENFKTMIENLYNSNSKFILTTTMIREELKEIFGADIVSRFDEMAVYLESKKINSRAYEQKASNNVIKY